MTYDSQRGSFSREHIYLVELELDYCSFDFATDVNDLCKAAIRTIQTNAVSVDQFNIGDTIDGATSGGKGLLVDIQGTSPNYTFYYTVAGAVDFYSTSETITSSAGGSATKNSNLPVVQTTPGDDKCYNTFSTCKNQSSFSNNAVTTGSTSIDFKFFFTDYGLVRLDSGNYQLEGFYDNCRVKLSGFSNETNNRIVNIQQAQVNVLYIEPADIAGMVVETGNTAVTVDILDFNAYRFCEARSPHPMGVDAIPSLKSVSITPSKVDYTGGLGERSSVSLVFNDHPFNDLGVDKYVDERSYIATDRGTFWTKLRARNPNYQLRNLRLLTGYLEDGEYKEENFKAYNYVIDKFEVSGGQARITAKDPLLLASTKKAQVPAVSTGVIDVTAHPSGLAAGVISLTLSPSGIGDSEYPADGWVTLSGSEVASFTRLPSSDTLTLVRGQYNTADIDHDNDTVVQLCYQQTAKLDVILYDIMTNYANIDKLLINSNDWAAEIAGNTGIDGNLSGIITKPTDVNKVIKELSEAKPFSLYWNEIDQKLVLDVLKEPPEAANVLTMDSNIIEGSMKVTDKPKLRASTVYFTFGQIDPTKSLTDPNNYTQTIVRVDTDSIVKYDSNQIKTVVSRWIPSTDKTTAENAAQLYGRRFSDIPREISFSLDAKDNTLQIGQNQSINHYEMVDASGMPIDTIFQIISKQEAAYFNYKALEYSFGDTVTGDNDLSSQTIKISIDELNVNLYDKYFNKFGAPTGSTTAVFEVESNVIVGSTSSATAGLITDTWPAGATITLINRGFIVGKGGDGGQSGEQVGIADGGGGGDAISLGHAMTLENFGIVGGGGGGGLTALSFGAGGAGNNVGTSFDPSLFGSLETGGNAGSGDLGQDATSGTAVAGNAITTNGNTLTYDELSDIRGDVV